MYIYHPIERKAFCISKSCLGHVTRAVINDNESSRLLFDRNKTRTRCPEQPYLQVCGAPWGELSTGVSIIRGTPVVSSALAVCPGRSTRMLDTESGQAPRFVHPSSNSSVSIPYIYIYTCVVVLIQSSAFLSVTPLNRLTSSTSRFITRVPIT